MPYPELDRSKLVIRPLRERKSYVVIERDHVKPEAKPRLLPAASHALIRETAARIRKARQEKRAVVMAFGAHTIKNGLSPVLIRLLEDGWLTHLATNGAGIIHDWEFAFQGKSSEDVAANVAAGQFGIWEETGFYINLAIVVGAYEGLGYGESVGAMVETEGLTLPDAGKLQAEIERNAGADPDRAAAAADLLSVIRRFDLKPGRMRIPHPFKAYGVQAAASRLKIPFTGHPMIGHDIIYKHPMNHGAAIGRTALRDFLSYAESINHIEGGVYLSVGSAVMSPMIFEKSLAMAQNLQIQEGRHIDHHFILVVDLAEAGWDWAGKGEPPRDNPAYFLRYCKTFSRMGGTMRYLAADNRDFLLTLHQELKAKRA